MTNIYDTLDREWDASFYDEEITFNMEEEELYQEVIFSASASLDDEDDLVEDEVEESGDWGNVDPQNDGIPSDNDPAFPGSAI